MRGRHINRIRLHVQFYTVMQMPAKDAVVDSQAMTGFEVRLI
jgi:hypothetical protein